MYRLLLLCFRFRLQGKRTFNNSDLKLQRLTRRRTDIKDVGESTLVVGEQTVDETTRRRNDRIALMRLV